MRRSAGRAAALRDPRAVLRKERHAAERQCGPPDRRDRLGNGGAMIRGATPGDARAASARFAAVLDQREFRSELDRLCVCQWHWGAPREVRIQALKGHRERCTFEIAVNTEGEWHRVIGKVYEVDHARAFQRREAVWHAGFGSGAEFAI